MRRVTPADLIYPGAELEPDADVVGVQVDSVEFIRRRWVSAVIVLVTKDTCAIARRERHGWPDCVVTVVAASIRPHPRIERRLALARTGAIHALCRLDADCPLL